LIKIFARINETTKNESQKNEPSVNEEAEKDKLPINDESSKDEALIENLNDQEAKIVEKPLVNEKPTIPPKEPPIKLPHRRLTRKDKICFGCCQIL
jgi:hypothetical protein